jgi:hypothetical protein
MAKQFDTQAQVGQACVVERGAYAGEAGTVDAVSATGRTLVVFLHTREQQVTVHATSVDLY